MLMKLTTDACENSADNFSIIVQLHWLLYKGTPVVTKPSLTLFRTKFNIFRMR